MREDFNGEQWVDDDGRPAGGVNYGFLAVVASRIEFYNSVGFRCDENDEALSHIYSALSALKKRTARREVEGVEGTYAGS